MGVGTGTVSIQDLKCIARGLCKNIRPTNVSSNNCRGAFGTHLFCGVCIVTNRCTITNTGEIKMPKVGS